MAKAKKHTTNDGVKLYNKILKEFTAINSKLPADRQMSIKDRRRYVSKEIYPQFKGTKSSKVGVKKIRTQILGVLETVVPKDGCDVNLISPSIYADVMWFDIDEFINDVLPKCILVRVDAGIYGRTKIFNTLNYNYYTGGVKKIVENIRKEVDNLSDATFTGVKKLMSGKPNDGTPENYFIDFILVINNKPIHPIEPVIYKITPDKKKKATTVRTAILSKIKDLSNKKRRRKNARKNAIKNIVGIKKINKRISKAKSPKFKNNLNVEKIEYFLKALKQLDSSYNKGNLSEEQYKRFKDELNKAIEDAKREGGIL